MPLASEKLSYPFAHGVDNEIDKRVLPENLIGCRNGVWRRDGRIEKRPGQSAMLANEVPDAQHSLITSGNKLAIVGKNDFSVNDATNGRMVRIGEQTGPSIIRRASIESSNDVDHSDVAICGPYTVVVYTTTEYSGFSSRGAVYYQVLDTATGSVLVPETLIYGGTSPNPGTQVRVEDVSIGGTPRAHVFYLVPNGPQFDLRLAVLDLSAPFTLGAFVVLATISACAQNLTGEALWHYDTSSQSGTASVVVYWNDDATPAIETKRISHDGVTIDTVTTAVTQGINRGQLCIYARAEITTSVGACLLYQKHYNTTSPAALTVNMAYTAVLAGPMAIPAMPVLPYSALFLVRSNNGAGTARTLLAIGNDASEGFLSTERIQFAEFALTMVGATFRRQLWGRVVGKPYFYMGASGADTLTWPVLAIQMYTDAAAQPNIILAAIYNLSGNKQPAGFFVPWDVLPIGRLNVDTAQNAFRVHPKANVMPINGDDGSTPFATDWLFSLLVRKVLRNVDGFTGERIFESRPDLLAVSHAQEFPLRYTEQADNAYVAAGALQSFSGGILREQAFNFRPFFEVSSAASVPKNPGVTADYQYTVIFEQYDERGDLIRSSPAEAREISYAVPGTSTTVEIRLPIYVVGQGDEQTLASCRIAIFRTIVGGGAFFRLLTLPALAPGGVYTNWPTVSVVDTLPDSGLFEVLYTESGRLPADPPPAPVDVAVYQERIALIGGQDPDEVWISQQKEGGVGAEFSTTLRVRVPAGRGDAVALAAMDEKLIVFKESAIYAFAAEGPNPLGQGTFGQAREVSSDIGCINKHSVDTNEAGIFFESPAGIYLLDRGLNLTFIGGPMIDKLPGAADENFKVRRSVSCQQAKEIYFLTTADTATVLCFNYRWGRWTWFEFPGSIVDLAVAYDKLVMLRRRFGRMLLTTEGADLSDAKEDGADFYGLLIQTPWFKVGGLSGWQRTRNVRFLGEYRGQHNLAVRTFHDNDDTGPSGSWTFTDAVLNPGTVGQTYWTKVKLPRQKSASVRFEFEEEQVSVGQAGFGALDMMLEYAVKEAGMPVPAARKG